MVWVFSPQVSDDTYVSKPKETTESSLQICCQSILPITPENICAQGWIQSPTPWGEVSILSVCTSHCLEGSSNFQCHRWPKKNHRPSHFPECWATLSHPERSHLPGRQKHAQELSAHCATTLQSSQYCPPIFLWKMTIPLKYGTSSHGTLWCDSTAPEPQLIFPQGASISASKCSWRRAIICTVIKLNPLLDLALSLNNTSVWVIHSQGTNTSPGRTLSMMYWHNTSECTPAIRIYGHHTSSRWGWVVMYGSEDGTVQQWTRPGPRG